MQRDGEVKGTDGEDGMPLPRPDPSFLGDDNILDASASDHDVRVGVRHVVAHFGEEWISSRQGTRRRGYDKESDEEDLEGARRMLGNEDSVG